MVRPLSAAQIRAVFGENLRQLCAGEKSVSEACRAIGVNRTQFSRYLAGEAFPRPDLLMRICEYFGVDANVLIRRLRPGTDDRSVDVLALSFQHLAGLLPGASYATSEQQLPSGVYRIWRRSFMWPEYVFRCHCLIWRDGPLTHWKSYEPSMRDLLYLHGEPTLPERRRGNGVVMRRYNGVVLNVNHSVCILGAPPHGSPVMRLVSLKPGFEGIPTIYSGICTLTQGLQTGALTVCPAVMEPSRAQFGELLRQSREKYFYRADELPSRLARYMFETPVL